MVLGRRYGETLEKHHVSILAPGSMSGGYMGEKARIDLDEIFPSQLEPACERGMEGARVKGLVKVGVHISIPASASV